MRSNPLRTALSSNWLDAEGISSRLNHLTDFWPSSLRDREKIIVLLSATDSTRQEAGEPRTVSGPYALQPP